MRIISYSLFVLLSFVSWQARAQTCTDCSDSTLSLNDSLKACYPFNQNVNDESGNGNNGTLTGPTTPTYGMDRFGGTDALYFTNGFVNCGTAIPHTTRDITISAWIYVPSTAAGTPACIMSNRSAGVEGIALAWNNDEIEVVEGGGGGLTFVATTTAPVPRDQWTHVAATFDYNPGGSTTDNTVSIYVNGVLQATSNAIGDILASPDPFRIGAEVNGGNIYTFDGWIDDIRYYDRLIDSMELRELAFYYCCNARNDSAYQQVIGDLTISADQVWEGKYYVEGIITFNNGARIDLTNVDILFAENSGFVFNGGSKIQANNSVFRPCNINAYWLGFSFNQSNTGIIENCIYKNALDAIKICNDTMDSDTVNNGDVRIVRNSFIECVTGVEICKPDYQETIVGNDFHLSRMGDLNGSSVHYGIKVVSNEYTFSIVQNEFQGMVSGTPNQPDFGIAILEGRAQIHQNTFDDFYHSIYVNDNVLGLSIENNQFNRYLHNLNLGSNSAIFVENSEFGLDIINNQIKSNKAFFEMSLQHGAIEIHNSSGVIISRNTIEGYAVGINMTNTTESRILENNLNRQFHIGVYMEDGYDNRIKCNTIDLAYDDQGLNIGIEYRQTHDSADAGLEIWSNCILDTKTAIYLTSLGSNITIPRIINNYLYNYIAFGIDNNGFVGNIGFNQFNIASSGRNTFVSHNTPNLAIDVNSLQPMIIAGNFNVQLVSATVAQLGMDEFYSSASCGRQIGLVPTGTTSQQLLAEETCLDSAYSQGELLINVTSGASLVNENKLPELFGHDNDQVKADEIINLYRMYQEQGESAKAAHLRSELENGNLIQDASHYADYCLYYIYSDAGEMDKALQRINMIQHADLDAWKVLEIGKLALTPTLNRSLLDHMYVAANGAEAGAMVRKSALDLFDYWIAPASRPIDHQPTDPATISVKKVTSNNLEVSPNPGNFSVNIDVVLQSDESGDLMILNSMGQQVHAETVHKGFSRINYNVESLTPGIYFVVLSSGTEKRSVMLSVIH